MRGAEYTMFAKSVDLPYHWYGYARGFMLSGDIYINDDAFYLNNRDRALLLSHEEGHVNAPEHDLTWLEGIIGADHTLTGVMSPLGLVRYLTAKRR